MGPHDLGVYVAQVFRPPLDNNPTLEGSPATHRASDATLPFCRKSLQLVRRRYQSCYLVDACSLRQVSSKIYKMGSGRGVQSRSPANACISVSSCNNYAVDIRPSISGRGGAYEHVNRKAVALKVPRRLNWSTISFSSWAPPPIMTSPHDVRHRSSPFIASLSPPERGVHVEKRSKVQMGQNHCSTNG